MVKAVLAAAIVWTLALAVEAQDTSVRIDVIYESLCPDSINWMKEQLAPTWQQLGAEHLQVVFNPFGHASFNATDEGGWTFECQHGPEECRGNLWQGCLLDKLQDNTVEVEAVLCLMSDDYPPDAMEKCMTDLGITDPSYEIVAQCQGSIEGQNILHDFGLIYYAENPPVTWVPWVKVNEEYIEEDFDALQYDLLNHLCQKYLVGVEKCILP